MITRCYAPVRKIPDQIADQKPAKTALWQLGHHINLRQSARWRFFLRKSRALINDHHMNSAGLLIQPDTDFARGVGIGMLNYIVQNLGQNNLDSAPRFSIQIAQGRAGQQTGQPISDGVRITCNFHLHGLPFVATI
nr:hypothetical protein [Pseudorhodobacter sp.]